MRHPTNRASRLLAIKRRIAEDRYDESAGIEAVCDAIMAEQVWSIGDPVLPVLRLVSGADEPPPAGPSPRRGGPVSSEGGAE